MITTTNAIHQLRTDTVKIAQEPSRHLTSEPILEKNRVWVNAHVGLRDFRTKISLKNCPVQFAFGFGRTEPRPDWMQIGGSSDTLSRLKGIGE